MHPFVLILVLVIFGRDLWGDQNDDPLRIGWSWASVVILPKLLIAGVYLALSRWTLTRLPTRRAVVALRAQERATSAYRLVILTLYCVDLWWVDTLGWLRGQIGDLVLVDELLVMGPAVAMLAWGWWAYYPIDSRLRQAILLRQLDAGRPVHPVWTLGQYMLAQLRHQVVAVLVPLALLLSWIELIDRYAPSRWPGWDVDPRPLLLIAGCGGLLVLAPVAIRYVWDTTPLPGGRLRDELMAMCRKYRVGVRQLLLWRTFGAMVNGAMMGLIAPVRYILLTDALLERLSREQVEAVMAHELAHIHHRHMLWLMTVAGASFGVLSVGWAWIIDAAARLARVPIEDAPAHVLPDGWLALPNAMAGVTVAATVVGWVMIFGWVSRRFERQADTFAVTHLSQSQTWRADTPEAPDHPDPGSTIVRDKDSKTIDEPSVRVMVEALQSVAMLNHLSPTRHSWRHGSIHWRQTYLRALVGKPIDDLPIDRQVFWIKITAAAAMVGLFLFTGSLPDWFERLVMKGMGEG